MPRKTKYSKELINEVCGYIQDGLPNKDAAELAGIGETTFYEWLSNSYDNPLTEDEKAEFRESMYIARAKRHYKLASAIIKASETNWRAAAWYLERTCPEEYGNNVKVEEFNEQEGEIDIPEEVKEKFHIAFRYALLGRNPSDYIMCFNDDLVITETCSVT